jgi:penicillin amidase
VRWLKRLFGWALGLVLALGLFALGIVQRQQPGLATPPIPGLTAEVRVDLDARGVPTIRAANLRDAFRVQGYLTARERLFQMELHRRLADGRLAELFGPGALRLDRLHRVYNFTAVAEAAAAQLPPEERADLAAFADGVNAFMRERAGRLGVEFLLLGFQPAPWTPADAIKGLLLMNEDMSTSWRQELRSEALAALPEAARRFLAPAVTDRDSLLVPDAQPGPRPDAAFLFGATPSAARAEAPDTLGLGPEAGTRSALVGSNNWVVAGWRSASGKPLLANDPHLTLSVPSAWFPLRVELPGRWWQGAGLVDLPGVILGENESFAWGFTNLGTDVQDLYREPAIGERLEEITVRGARPERLHVPLGAHGPQVRAGYSLRWTALEPGNLRIPSRPLMEARDWRGFNGALDGFPGPAMNVVYADRAGHIGWRATGLLPIRPPGQDGSRPLDGADPAQDWRGYVPAEQMPRLLDPAEGFIATANQRIIGTAFPHPVATRWASPLRVQRIRELLQGGGKLDRAGLERIQLDVVSSEHRDLLQLALPQLPAPDRARFRGWSGAARADSVLFTEAERFRSEFQALLQGRLVAGLGLDARPDWPNADAALRAALSAGPEAWRKAGLGDPGDLVREAWTRAHRERPRPWGEVNRLDLKHPLGRAGGVLSWLFDPRTAPQDGASHTVRVTGAEFGQSLRLLVDLGRPEDSTLVVCQGVSGHLGNPHRQDQLDTWLRGDPVGRATLMRAGAVSTLVFRGSP